MNIEKLAKHLKEFTLDEIEMIAEENCKTELERLLNERKLSVNNSLYRYVEKQNLIDYEIFTLQKLSKKDLVIENAIKDFMQNYVKNRPVIQSEIYTVLNLIKRMPEIKNHEDKIVKAKKKEKPKVLTQELIKQINKNILSWDGSY